MVKLGRIAPVAGLVLALLAPAALAGTGLAGTAAAATGAHAAARQGGPAGVSAPEAAIEDARTGAVLWSRELYTERPMASITKVMTALVVLRIGGLNNVITVPKAVTGYVREYGASSAGLHPGDRLTVRQLLYALLLPSGSDAGYTLAMAYGPGIPAFVAKMNVTAQAIGMTQSHFSNFDGLPYPTGTSTYSTAADLLTMGRAAMAWSAFRAVVGTQVYKLPAGPGNHAYKWTNTNPLLGVYPGTAGIKTGWTPYSGHCLLFEATLGGITLIGVTLDAAGKGTLVNGVDPTRILNWAFAQPGI